MKKEQKIEKQFTAICQAMMNGFLKSKPEFLERFSFKCDPENGDHLLKAMDEVYQDENLMYNFTNFLLGEIYNQHFDEEGNQAELNISMN